MTTVVAIHQPNYLPWLGYFEKAVSSDVFIVLDHVQHIRQSLTRRTLVRKQPGSLERSLLSIPLREHDRFAPINTLRLSGTEWAKDHLNKFDTIYRNAPEYSLVRDKLLSTLSQFKDGDLLSEVNFELIRNICVLIGIPSNFRLSSRMACSSSGSSLMAELTDAEGGCAYYSGGGASSYTDESDFGARGIAISYQQFAEYTQANPYAQLQGGWLPGLSVVDALSNIGPAATLEYIRGYSTWLRSKPMSQDWDPMIPSDPAPDH